MKTKAKLVYLDTNIYCRPCDNQSDTRIHEETEAFLQITDEAEKGKIVIVSSEYVKFEIELIKDPLKRKNIKGFEKLLSKSNVNSNNQLLFLAKEIKSECKLNSLDALHLAAAFLGEADFLLTCDDEILDNAICIEKLAVNRGYKLKVRNPLDYIKKDRE